MKSHSSPFASGLLCWPTLLAFAIGAAIMAVLQTAPVGLIGADSFYHVKMALMLPEVGYLPSFPWLHWTIFRDHFVSHHYGFQTLLAPWVWASQLFTGSPVAGAKLAAVTAAGLTSALFFRLLRQRSIPHALFWTTLLAWLPWHFWMRLTYIRAPMVALPLLLLATGAMVAGRNRTCGLLAFLFVQVYFGAVVFALLPAAFIAGRILAGEACRRDLGLVIWTAVGLAAGFVINPYFPENIAFMKIQLFDTGLGATVRVGNEWRPLDTWSFLVMSAPLLALWGSGLLRYLKRGARPDGTTLALLFLNAGFLVLTLKARRFVEYWPLFALLNAADLARFSADPFALRWLKQSRWPTQATLAALMLVALIGVPNLAKAYRVMQKDLAPAPLVQAMAFLENNSPPDSMILTDDWDQFPMCFYLNTHNTYAVGLDPAFTAVPYPELWDRYRLLTSGRVPASLDVRFTVLEKKEARMEDIRDHFRADYVVVRNDHARFARKLAERKDLFTLVYPDDGPDDGVPLVSVFQVRSATKVPANPPSPALP